MLLPLLTGVSAGIVHALTGLDHLAAVSPFVANRPRNPWRVGLRWGLGHTYGVWLVALLAVVVKEAIPVERLSGWAEGVVGVTLIGIGIWSFHKALRHSIHYHEHSHDGVQHAHFHIHRRIEKHHNDHHRHKHTATGLGLLHGLAGGSHLVAVLPAVALPGVASVLQYLVGYGLGSITAMCVFSWALGKLLGRWIDGYARVHNFALGVFAAVAIGVGILWLNDI